MADVPWPLWPGRPETLAAAVGLTDAAWRVLGALWRLVDAGATAAGPPALWESRAAGRRPCVWPSAETLGKMCELKERAVRKSLAELESRGLIEGGRRDAHTWYRWLLDPEADTAVGRPRRHRRDLHDGALLATEGPAPSCLPEVHSDAPHKNDRPAPACTPDVGLPPAPLHRAPAARVRVRQPARPSLRLLGAQPCTPEEGERSEEAAAAAVELGCTTAQVHGDAGAPLDRGTMVHLSEQFTGRAPAGAAAPTDGTSGRCQVAGSSSTRHPADQHPQQRPASTVAGDAAPPARPAATTSGTSAGRRWDAVELIVELGMIHLPAPAQRIAADRRTRERAEQLLELPLEGLSEDDAQAARRARFEAVLATAKSFTRYLEATPEKRHFWRGGMLSLKARARADGGDGTSPWEAVEKDVAEAAQVEAELERGREAARAMVAAQATEAERVAAGRVTPELAAAGASELFRRLRDRETAGSTG